MEIREKLQTICNEYVADTNDTEELLKLDSIKYMSIIIEVEKKFNIVIPDECLSYNVFSDIDSFIEIIEGLVNPAGQQERVDNAGVVH